MKKGIVFTIDAILAFGIFLSSLFLFSQFFVDTSYEGITKTNVYSQSEEFLKTWENQNEKFYNIYSTYINNDSNEENLNEILETFTVVMMGVNQTGPYQNSTYPANLRFYIFDNNSMQLIAESSEQNFEQNIVLRRFIIYKDMFEVSNLGNVTNISAESSLPNSTIKVNVTVENSGSSDWTNVDVAGYVFGQSWDVTPASYSTNINAGNSEEFEFQVDIPSDATAYTYTFKVNLSYDGRPEGELYDASFHVIKYGLVEMEVGLK